MVTQSRMHVPSIVPILNPLMRVLLRMGVPMGPNANLTIRGRKSGVMRTSPVAVLEWEGRRWVVGTFGDTNWVRNLRAAGEAVLSTGRKREAVRAVELSRDQAADFFGGVMRDYIGSSAIKRSLLGILGAADTIEDPSGSAARRPVFELR